ncbi:hypothetical protein [Nocardia stercoris]|uniref:hypothetical protein n=1 Tax=Nocardia stercoris TaxID=2483361 RepID=UPI0011C3F55A|nr:hypothetical protein [Nocardia stercoris]
MLSLPDGPAWALYGFNMPVSATMLALWLRYQAAHRSTSPATTVNYLMRTADAFDNRPIRAVGE